MELIITDNYTANSAAIVHNDTVFLYEGYDDPETGYNFYHMPEWLIYYSTHMDNWTEGIIPKSCVFSSKGA